MGFTNVLRYKPGKMDWLANGLPFEGTESREQRAGDIALMDVPTCRPSDTIAEIRARMDLERWQVCVAVNEAWVVMGFLDSEALQADPQQTAETVMQVDIRTFRLDRKIESVQKYMRGHDLDYALVTNVDGRLFGLIKREDVEKR